MTNNGIANTSKLRMSHIISCKGSLNIPFNAFLKYTFIIYFYSNCQLLNHLQTGERKDYQLSSYWNILNGTFSCTFTVHTCHYFLEKILRLKNKLNQQIHSSYLKWKYFLLVHSSIFLIYRIRICCQMLTNGTIPRLRNFPHFKDSAHH